MRQPPIFLISPKSQVAIRTTMTRPTRIVIEPSTRFPFNCLGYSRGRRARCQDGNRYIDHHCSEVAEMAIS